MKIKRDFTTNSSSTSFMCLQLKSRELEEKVLSENNMSYESIEEKWEESYEEEITLKGNLYAVLGECGEVYYIGKDLWEDDLTNQTLTQLKEKMVSEFNAVYETKITVDDIDFEYGEISR